MANLYSVPYKRKHKRRNTEGRFYTQLDMSIIKHDAAVRNSMIKRGEVTPSGQNHYISECGCGSVGCFIHGSFESRPKDTEL